MLAVLDPNVVISGVLSPRGAPAEVLRALEQGEFELLLASPLIDELRRALAYPKLRRHIPAKDAENVVRWLLGSASAVTEPPDITPIRSRDPADDYLVGLAWRHNAALVSGDRDLLELREQIPVFSPADFLVLLRR